MKNWSLQKPIVFVAVLTLSLSVHAHRGDVDVSAFAESGSARVLGIQNSIQMGDDFMDGQNASSLIPQIQMPLIQERNCYIPNTEENRAQRCEAAIENAREHAARAAQERAQEEAERKAIEEMKGRDAACKTLASLFRSHCVDIDLKGVGNEPVNSCAEMLPVIADVKEVNQGVLNECQRLFERLEAPCTETVVGEVPARTVEETRRSSDNMAVANAVNPDKASFPLPPEEDMVNVYQNMLANFNILKDLVHRQIANLDQAETDVRGCMANDLGNTPGDINVATQQMSYTEDIEILGLETSRDNVGLLYASRKAAEADAMGAWQEARAREEAGLPPSAVLSDATPDYIVRYTPSNKEQVGTPKYYSSVNNYSSMGGGGTAFELIGGGSGDADKSEIKNIPIPMPRPAHLSSPTPTTPQKAQTPSPTQSRATVPQTQSTSPTLTTGDNNPSQKYLENTNAYGGGSAANGSGGFNPSQMLSQLGRNGATASEKVGQYNGVDYSGNSFYGNTNGRYRADADNFAATGKNSSPRANGFVRDSGFAPTGNMGEANKNMNAASRAATHRGANYAFQGMAAKSDGTANLESEKQQADQKGRTDKSRNKQIYSNKTVNSPGAAPSYGAENRILSKDSSRSPASKVEDKYKTAKKRGEEFDPSKYEPRDLAARKAYERVTGKHVAGRRSNGLPWPRDIRQCKRPDSCKDVFGHMSDQFRVQLLTQGI